MTFYRSVLHLVLLELGMHDQSDFHKNNAF